MYGWYVTGWAENDNIPLLSDWSHSCKEANVDAKESDTRPEVKGATFVWGVFGL